VTGAPAALGTPLELTVPIPGGVDGEVREHVTGAPVPGARIDATGPGEQKASATTAKAGAGSFRLLRLRPGHWTFTASAPGYRTATRDLEVPAAPTLNEASVRGLRLELDSAR
jgi:hypothetical protein